MRAATGWGLTDLSAGAQITPLNSHLMVAQEVDTTVGGLPPLNNAVDAGDRFTTVGGPSIANSPVYTASSTIVGDTANVGASGFVQQSPVPLPAAGYLFGLALFGLAGLKKRPTGV